MKDKGNEGRRKKRDGERRQGRKREGERDWERGRGRERERERVRERVFRSGSTIEDVRAAVCPSDNFLKFF